MANGLAIIIGASGGIGAAVFDEVRKRDEHAAVWGTARTASHNAALQVDITDESSVENMANAVKDAGIELALVFDATGYLHGPYGNPEKSWSQLDPGAMAHQFAINTIGPSLLMKHLFPLFPRRGRAVFATISAKVGSISDNRLGGWYGYRAAKAALNQIVKTASIELARKRPDSLCVALHPGTVDTPLSEPFAKSSLRLQTPQESASAMLDVIHELSPEDSGKLFAYDGTVVPF